MSQFNSEKFWRYHGMPGQRVLDKDTPCASCGYNLRGLKYGAVCPECGTPMLVPRRGGEFTHAPAEYLIRMSRGLLCLMLAWVCLFGLTFVGYWILLVPSMQATMLLVGSLLTVGGCYLLDCRRPNEARPINMLLDPSRLAFVCSILYGVTALVVTIASWQSGQSGPGSATFEKIAILSGLLSAVALVATQTFVTMWLCDVAMEAQDSRLSEAFNHQWWAFAILGGLACISTIVFAWLRVAQGGSMPVPCLGCFLPILFVILIEVWWIWTVLRLKRVCMWAIRYQEFDAGRADRDRERGERMS